MWLWCYSRKHTDCVTSWIRCPHSIMTDHKWLLLVFTHWVLCSFYYFTMCVLFTPIENEKDCKIVCCVSQQQPHAADFSTPNQGTHGSTSKVLVAPCPAVHLHPCCLLGNQRAWLQAPAVKLPTLRSYEKGPNSATWVWLYYRAPAMLFVPSSRAWSLLRVTLLTQSVCARC